MTEELIIKFLQNKCSSDEIEEVIKWFRYGADNSSSLFLVKKIWNRYSPEKDTFKDIQFERILDKLHHNINISDAQKGQKSSGIVHLPEKKRLIFRNIITRAAVILFIPLLSVLIYTLSFSKFNDHVSSNKISSSNISSNIEIEAPVGSRTNVELSDGTKVWLNHGSKLSYPPQFLGKNRVVHLSGEAFFDVDHNPQKPFIVETEKIQVTALGTEFNVMAYPEEFVVKTTLVSGKVLVEKRLNQNETVEICEMQPNQLVHFNLKKNTYSCVKTKTGKHTSWKDGILIFDDDPIDEVTRRLSRWYNVEFVIENPKVRDYIYNATFIDETLPQILELMKIATPISYRITTRRKLPDGTFTKRKVYINLKNKS